ncbi:dihydrofolate reductase family protein [Sanguibacter sp. 25GB23B1]|uniref:dihydrofolate reductase family protein n=1 Tax=unclassified Sanguibacter TaxID=2645534 RepID=UPI0032AEC073
MSTQRKVIANIVVTLDGRTTGPGGPADMSPIARHGVSEQARDALVQMTSATTVLLGRVNYEGFHGYWPHVAHDPAADPRDHAFATWLETVDKIVFSTNEGDLAWTGSQHAQGSPTEVVRSLQQTGEGDIRILSSQSIIRQLLDADLVDTLEITHAPEIMGSGPTLFDTVRARSRWVIESAEATDSGAVRATYTRTRSPETNALGSPAARHRSFAQRFGHTIAATTDWEARSPVPEWQARDVVEHLLDWFPPALTAWTGITLPPAEEGDLAERWSARSHAVQELLDDTTANTTVADGPFAGSTVANTIDRVYTADVFMHTWDLARSSKLDPHLEPEFAAELLAGLRSMESVLRSSGQYGSAIETSSPDPVDQLMAFIGRTP